MRRKVRGTVSGIYMCSAALRRGSKRRPGSTAAACLATKRVLRVFFCCKILHKSRTSRPWLTYASALALRALCLTPDSLTMNQWEHSEVVTADARLALSQ